MNYWLFIIFVVEGPGPGLILNYMHTCKILWKFRRFQDASNLNRADVANQLMPTQAWREKETTMYLAKVLWPTLQLQLHDSASFRGRRQNLDLKSSYAPFLKPTVSAHKNTCILISNLKVDTNTGNIIIIIIIPKAGEFGMLD